MTDRNPFEAMMTQWQEMAKSWAPAMGGMSAQDIEKLWPRMPKEAMELFFGKTANPGGLDARTKLYVTLTGLTIAGAQADTALRQTVRHLKEAGAGAQEIAEAIATAGVFAGAPATARAMDLARQALEEDGD